MNFTTVHWSLKNFSRSESIFLNNTISLVWSLLRYLFRSTLFSFYLYLWSQLSVINRTLFQLVFLTQSETKSSEILPPFSCWTNPHEPTNRQTHKHTQTHKQTDRQTHKQGEKQNCWLRKAVHVNPGRLHWP